MKKLLLSLLVLAMLTACSSKEETPVADNTTNETEENTAVETAVASYKIYNMTGAKLTELYVYETGSEDKGENLAGEGLKNAKKVEFEKELATDVVLTVEFNYEGGETQTFTSLHNEVAPITLRSVDAAGGATAIEFAVPTGTGKYAITNETGADLESLYMYAAGSEDKGTNYAEEVNANGGSFELVFDGEYGQDYVLEFSNAGEEARNFPTLHIEEAPIRLLAADTCVGATQISFK